MLTLFGCKTYFIAELFGNWELPRLLDTVLLFKGLGAFKFMVGTLLPLISLKSGLL